MGQTLLLAESCDLLRIGLRTIFAKDPRVSHIHEVVTSSDLEKHLRSHKVDLVIVNQSLAIDITHLPAGNFVILTAKPDMAVLKAVYKHKGRGYLSEGVSAELLRTILSCHENAFLIEPSFTPFLIESLCDDVVSTLNDDLLTPREKEIVVLMRKGLDRPAIAKFLCIAEITLKTHIRNITSKNNLMAVPTRRRKSMRAGVASGVVFPPRV